MERIYRKYNTLLITSFFLITCLICLFNYAVDPFDIFHTVKIDRFNKYKPAIDRNQRVTKVLTLKTDKSDLYSIFLGSSRVNSSISESYYKTLTGKNTKNLGMNALSHSETIKLGKFAVFVHPEIKIIYVGLDFFRFLEKNKDEKRAVNFSKTKNVSLSEINSVLMSFDSSLASFNTLRSNIKQIKYEHDNKRYFVNKLKHYSKNYKNAELSDEEFKKLKTFKTEMEQNGYKVVFYTNPTHFADICLIDKMGYLPLFNKWKIKLAENFSYIDFDFINKMTMEEINQQTKYFIESSHASKSAGNLIISNLVSAPDGAIALYTDKNNVKNHILKNNTALKAGEKLNPFWTDIIERSITGAI